MLGYKVKVKIRKKQFFHNIFNAFNTMLSLEFIRSHLLGVIIDFRIFGNHFRISSNQRTYVFNDITKVRIESISK